MIRRQRYDPNEKTDRIDTMGTNVYSEKDNQSLHKSLNGEFLLYQILLQQLLDKKSSFKNKPKSIKKYFRPIDPNDKKMMKEFDNEYRSDKAIHWYTRESCIYKILNKALRTQTIDDIVPFEHFIRDLDQQLSVEQRSFVKQLKSSILTVYRGQLISKDEVSRLKTAKGALICMNSFLSTSTNRKKALEFATSRPPPNDQLTSILLEIEVDTNALSRPYADIKHLSAFAEEEEILFMFGCIFRIQQIVYDEKIKLWMASFQLCSENDQDYKEFTASLNKEIKGQDRFISLGNYLIEMQKYDDAEEHFEKILQHNLATNPVEFAYCHHGLAQVNKKKEDYQLGITNINKALDYLSNDKSIDKDHPLISQCYNDLGSIYGKQHNYLMAFEFYEKALRKKNNILLNTYSGLADIHGRLKNYFIALEYYEKAVQNQFNASDSIVANVYIQMGDIYSLLDEKEKSTEMFDKATKLQLKSLPPDHPDVSYTYLALSAMASQRNDDENALKYIEKALQVQLQSLPNQHADFAQTYTKFGDFYDNKSNYDQALEYHHKALDNQLKTLTWFHPSVTQTYLKIGLVNKKKKDYEQTLIYFHKVLDSELQRKKFGTPSLTVSFRRLADQYNEINNIDKALEYYLKTIENEFETKLFEDISLIELYQIIAEIYLKQSIFDQSLIYYNRLLDCYSRQTPIDENLIKQVYTLIGNVYLKKTQFDKTFVFYQNKKITESKDIENVYFEKRHLDLITHFYERNLKQVEKTPSENDTYQILATVYFEKGNYDQSLFYFLKLLKNLLKKKTKQDPTLGNLYQIIGQIYLKKQDHNQSLIYFYRFLDCQQNRNIFSNSQIHQIYIQIGNIYLKKDVFNQSSNYMERLININNRTIIYDSDFPFERRHLEQTIVYFQTLLNTKYFQNFKIEEIYHIISNLYIEKEDYNQALIYSQQLLQYVNQTDPMNYLLLAKINENIGNIYKKQTNNNQALEYYRQSLHFYEKFQPYNQFLIDNIQQKIHQILLPMNK